MTSQRPRVGLFVTCLVDLVRPQVGFAAVKLLEDAGFDVHVPGAQTCCGQPAWNAGADSHARDIAREVVDLFEPFEYIVAPSGSCAGMIKRHYPEVFENDPVYLAKARALAQKTHELMGFLAKFGPGSRAIVAKCAAKVCYHDSCSSLREMGVKDEPRALLNVVDGLTLAEMKDAQICCGFGGLFSVKYPEISERMADDKIADVLASGADTLVAGDLGCLLHLAGRAEKTGKTLRVRHAAEILAGMGDEPALGEKPK
jgi:L-lactate dehydrogenase complex protein LldE